jgi:hypothetical protein
MRDWLTFRRLWHGWPSIRPLNGHHNVYGWDRWLRRQHPEVERFCGMAKQACEEAHPSEAVEYTVVRAVEADRVVVAVIVANPPGVHRRGRRRSRIVFWFDN